MADPNADHLDGELSDDECPEWFDGIPDDLDETDIPQSHREELDRRLAWCRDNPGASLPWEDLRAKLLRRIDAGSDDAERR